MWIWYAHYLHSIHHWQGKITVVLNTRSYEHNYYHHFILLIKISYFCSSHLHKLNTIVPMFMTLCSYLILSLVVRITSTLFARLLRRRSTKRFRTRWTRWRKIAPLSPRRLTTFSKKTGKFTFNMKFLEKPAYSLAGTSCSSTSLKHALFLSTHEMVVYFLQHNDMM